MKLKQTEASVHQQIVNYLKLQYPKVLFRTDFAAGIKMTIGQAVKHKKLQHGSKWPDLFIAAPSHSGKYPGLFLEIKRDFSEVRNKKGELRSNEHVQRQDAMLACLRSMNYKAEFACGYWDAIIQIDEYLTGKSNHKNRVSLEWSGSVNLKN